MIQGPFHPPICHCFLHLALVHEIQSNGGPINQGHRTMAKGNHLTGEEGWASNREVLRPPYGSANPWRSTWPPMRLHCPSHQGEPYGNLCHALEHMKGNTRRHQFMSAMTFHCPYKGRGLANRSCCWQMGNTSFIKYQHDSLNFYDNSMLRFWVEGVCVEKGWSKELQPPPNFKERKVKKERNHL